MVCERAADFVDALANCVDAAAVCSADLIEPRFELRRCARIIVDLQQSRDELTDLAQCMRGMRNDSMRTVTVTGRVHDIGADAHHKRNRHVQNMGIIDMNIRARARATHGRKS